MTRSKLRHRTRSGKEERGGLALLLFGGFALLSIVGVAIWIQYGRVETDALTGCPKSGPVAITAIVLDVSDKLGPIQLADLMALMDDVRDQVPKYGRLDLYTVGVVEQHPLDVQFRSCNPGSAKDIQSALTGNAALAERAWRKRFADKLQEALGRILAAKPQDVSPILESVQSVSVTSFDNADSRKAETRLVLVSDLLQYTKRASFYNGAPDFTVFKATPYYREVRTALTGTNVTLAIIPRETKKSAQNKRLLDFWTSYFADQGALVDRWRPIKGGGA